MRVIYTKSTGRIQQLAHSNQDINLLLQNYDESDYIEVESIPCSFDTINSSYYVDDNTKTLVAK